MSPQTTAPKKSGIPQINLTGPHECMTDAQAMQERERRRAPMAKTYLDGYTIQELGKYLMGAAACLFIGVVVLYCLELAALNSWYFWPLGLAGFVGWVMFTRPEPRDQPDSDLDTLSLEQLRDLEKIANDVPQVRSAIAGWLEEGKRLRVRDYVACQRYAESWRTRTERDTIIARLADRGAPSPLMPRQQPRRVMPMADCATSTFPERRAAARRERRKVYVENLIFEHCHEHGHKIDDFVAVPLAAAILDYLDREAVREARRASSVAEHTHSTETEDHPA